MFVCSCGFGFWGAGSGMFRPSATLRRVEVRSVEFPRQKVRQGGYCTRTPLCPARDDGQKIAEHSTARASSSVDEAPRNAINQTTKHVDDEKPRKGGGKERRCDQHPMMLMGRSKEGQPLDGGDGRAEEMNDDEVNNVEEDE